MTTFDLIDRYLFDCVSTAHHRGANGGCSCGSMVEEMNEIRESYRNGASIEDVLNKCVCNRHGHQYCIATAAVEAAAKALKEASFVCSRMCKVPFVDAGKIYSGFNDFEELYDFIKSVIGEIKGIGSLTVYDTAKRIGLLLDTPIYPKMYVYLAAGAKKGAESLLGKKDLHFREPIDYFKPHFGTLPSIFIEDMLCIFENELNGSTRNVMTGETEITIPTANAGAAYSKPSTMIGAI